MPPIIFEKIYFKHRISQHARRHEFLLHEQLPVVEDGIPPKDMVIKKVEDAKEIVFQLDLFSKTNAIASLVAVENNLAIRQDISQFAND